MNLTFNVVTCHTLRTLRPFSAGRAGLGYHQRRMIKLPPTLDRLLRFGLVGVGIFAIALGLTALQHEVFGFSEELAFGITLVVVLVVGFLANRHLVFDASAGDVRRQSAHYAVASLVFRALQYLSFLALHTWLGMAYPVAITIVLWSWFFIKFLYYGKRIFIQT